MSGTTVKADAIVIGIVKDLKDPLKLGRVRVELPHADNKLSDWARIATLMAGPDRGSLFRPEPEDEVLIGFLHGDPAQPYVLGALWNDVDTPPENGGSEKNDVRTLRSRSGHVLRFVDKRGGAKIELIGSQEKQHITVDVDGGTITVEAMKGDIAVQAGAGSITIKGSTSVSVQSDKSIEMTAPAIKLEASTSLTLKGGVVRIN
jgi:uncharacterized protein involved in type VI secretion and phage assembly